jgi:exodeoxyribonuclease VIII
MSQTKPCINVMLDLETLGLKPEAKVLSIGAVVFDIDKGIGEEFYKEIALETSSGEVDMSTLKFWFDQAAKGSPPPINGQMHEFNAVQYFWEWLSEISRNFSDELVIWANGTDFDIPKITRLLDHHHANQTLRWKYSNVRDYRTIAKIFGAYGIQPDKINHHNALADVHWQAKHLSSILRTLRELGINVRFV